MKLANFDMRLEHDLLKAVDLSSQVFHPGSLHVGMTKTSKDEIANNLIESSSHLLD